jgi:hypothetical protein
MLRAPHAAVWLVSIVLAPLPCAALQRAFVASYGSDANTAMSCVLTSPCRGFAAAMTVVDAGGEIVALDAAGYAAVAINKSVTITASPGFHAGIAAPTGLAVNINAAGATVTLRGLSINGTGAPTGIYMASGSRLTIDNCVISNFTEGIVVLADGADVRIADSVIADSSHGLYFGATGTAMLTRVRLTGNATYGLHVRPGTPGTMLVSMSDSVISGAGTGAMAESIASGQTPRLAINRSTISNNQVGVASVAPEGFASVVVGNSTVTGSTTAALLQSGFAALHTLGNNMITHNIADQVGTISSLAPQ